MKVLVLVDLTADELNDAVEELAFLVEEQEEGEGTLEETSTLIKALQAVPQLAGFKNDVEELT